MWRLLTVLLSFALAITACEQDDDQREISKSLGDIVGALETANWGALWEASHPEAQAQVIELHRSLHDALEMVGALYATAELPIARAALGRDLVSGIPKDAPDLGPRMLSRLFAAGAIRLDDKARAGLTTTRATIDGVSAIVHTTAGEVFTFGRSGGVWRSRLLIDMLERSRAVATLRESVSAVQAAAKSQHEAWSTSRDPRHPQGAYNLLRSAMERTPVDASVAYALLDSEAKAVLVEALEAARKLQSRIQKRTPKRQREAAYSRHGISLHVEAGSDRDLYEAWAASDTFIPPVTDAARPERVEPGETDTKATVVTTSNKRVAFSRDDEGVWRLDGYTPQVRKALLSSVKPPTAPKD